MNIRLAWIVAKKDMAEFKTNKYIIFTLFVIPIIYVVLLPLSFFAPLSMMAGQNQELPNDINITPTSTYENGSFESVAISDSLVRNANLTYVTVTNSIVINSTLTRCVVNSSILKNVSLDHSLVQHSNLENILSNQRSLIENSYVAGEENEELLTILNVMLNSLVLFFIMMPAIIPTVIASYSFVGEKLSRSLEPLLASPASDAELLLGKSLSIFVPSMAVTWISFVAMTVLTDILVFPILGYYPVPNGTWLISAFILAPLFCILSISFNVFVSSKVSDVRASQQIGAVIILPLVLFFVGVVVGVLPLGIVEILAASLVVAAIDVGVIWVSLKTFRREEILVNWK